VVLASFEREMAGAVPVFCPNQVIHNDLVREAQLTSDHRGRAIRVYWLETPGRVPFQHMRCDIFTMHRQSRIHEILKAQPHGNSRGNTHCAKVLLAIL